MAHPDVEQPLAVAAAVILDTFKQTRVTARLYLGVAKLPLAGARDPPAQAGGHALHAVTDAKDRHAEFEHH